MTSLQIITLNLKEVAYLQANILLDKHSTRLYLKKCSRFTVHFRLQTQAYFWLSLVKHNQMCCFSHLFSSPFFKSLRLTTDLTILDKDLTCSLNKFTRGETLHSVIQRIGETVEHWRRSLTNMYIKRFTVIINENLAFLSSFANSEIVSLKWI